MPTNDWYVDMGAAVARRERALRMVDQWTRKAKIAEEEIQALALTKNPEPAQE